MDGFEYSRVFAIGIAYRNIRHIDIGLARLCRRLVFFHVLVVCRVTRRGKAILKAYISRRNFAQGNTQCLGTDYAFIDGSPTPRFRVRQVDYRRIERHIDERRSVNLVAKNHVFSKHLSGKFHIAQKSDCTCAYKCSLHRNVVRIFKLDIMRNIEQQVSRIRLICNNRPRTAPLAIGECCGFIHVHYLDCRMRCERKCLQEDSRQTAACRHPNIKFSIVSNAQGIQI